MYEELFVSGLIQKATEKFDVPKSYSSTSSPDPSSSGSEIKWSSVALSPVAPLPNFPAVTLALLTAVR